MKKSLFNLDQHPKFGCRRADLDPTQCGLIKITKSYTEMKKLGDAFEKNIYDELKNAFPLDTVLTNMIFESGNYIDSLKIYESLQLDEILITTCGVFCIEAKWISDNKYERLSGGAKAQTWTLKKKKGTTNSEVNGLKQNYRHKQFLEELFSKEGLVCPVYQMTVIGDLDRKKILIQQFIDANLVDAGEMIDRITYIKNRNKSINVDVKKVVDILKSWECKIDGREILHIVYARNNKTKKLPTRCKKIMRHL